MTARPGSRPVLVGGCGSVSGGATESDRRAKVATALFAQDGTTFDVSAPDVVTIR